MGQPNGPPLMAAPCSFTLPTGKVCGEKYTASIHLHMTRGFHEFKDTSRGGMNKVSARRRAYSASDEHQTAYEHVAGQCIFEAGGAPLVCSGPITPGHIVSRAVAGSLEEADRWPVAPQCARHNTEVDANPELRNWASEHFFRWHDGREYRYRYDRKTFERELLGKGVK